MTTTERMPIMTLRYPGVELAKFDEADQRATIKDIASGDSVVIDLNQINITLHAICAELERRDIEQATIENAINWLHGRESTFLYVLGWLVGVNSGRNDKNDKTMAKYMHDSLYPEAIGGDPDLANMQGVAMVFEQPARRWTQFGSKAELLEKALAHKIKGAKTMSREWLVKALWDKRALPGSVALCRRDEVSA